MKSVGKRSHLLHENSGLMNKANPLYSYKATEKKSSEKSSLSELSNSARSYGATHQPAYSICDVKLLQHVPKKEDTLQGLSLRYEVTVEQIKRANKLWTNDNIHILDILLIPVKVKSSQFVDLNDVAIIDAVQTSETISDHAGCSSTDSSKNGIDVQKNKGKNLDTLGDFLSNLDAQISTSKCHAEKFREVTGPKLIARLEGITNGTSSLDNSDDVYEPHKTKKSKTKKSKTSIKKHKRHKEEPEEDLRSDDEEFYEL